MTEKHRVNIEFLPSLKFQPQVQAPPRERARRPHRRAVHPVWQDLRVEASKVEYCAVRLCDITQPPEL